MRKYRRLILCCKDGENSDAAGIADMLDGVGIGKGGGGPADKVDAEDLIQDDVTDDGDEDVLDGDDDPGDEDADEDAGEANGEDASDEPVESEDNSQALLLKILENLTAKKEEPVAEPEPEEDPFADESFGELVDALAIDDKGANTLKKFMRKLLDVDRKQTVKDIMQELPKVTEQTLTAKQKQDNLKKAFYADNPQLAPVQGFVSAVAKEVAGDPKFNKNVESILAETAKRSYTALGLKKGKAAQDQLPERGKRTPAFPNSNHSRRQPAKVGKMRAEIDAMLDAL